MLLLLPVTLRHTCQAALLVCASKDGVLVQVLPLLFSVMQMQLLVIIILYYASAAAFFPLYSKLC